jgi:hypothetical protein
MMHDAETYQLEWQSIPIEISFKPDWLGMGFTAHIEVKANEPLPFTDPGYRSIFLNPDIVSRQGGAVAFVTGYLEEESTEPAWKQYQTERQQLSLF